MRIVWLNSLASFYHRNVASVTMGMSKAAVFAAAVVGAGANSGPSGGAMQKVRSVNCIRFAIPPRRLRLGGWRLGARGGRK